jgi:hypothetical protein
MILFVANFRHFVKNISKKQYSVENSLFIWNKILQKKEYFTKKIAKITSIAYNRKGCVSFFFLISYFEYYQILAKYTDGWSPLEQTHKIRKNKNTHWCATDLFLENSNNL